LPTISNASVRPSSSFSANWLVLEETPHEPDEESAADRLALLVLSDFAAPLFDGVFISDPGVPGVPGLFGVPGVVVLLAVVEFVAALLAVLELVVALSAVPLFTPAHDASINTPLNVLVFISATEPVCVFPAPLFMSCLLVSCLFASWVDCVDELCGLCGLAPAGACGLEVLPCCAIALPMTSENAAKQICAFIRSSPTRHFLRVYPFPSVSKETCEAKREPTSI